MRKFLLYLLYVTIGVSIVDVCCRFYFKHIYTEENFAQTELIREFKYMNARPAECIILGASTAHHNYDCKVFEDSLECTVFNYGMDGTGAYYHYLCLKKSLENGPVKYVVYDLGNSLLQDSWNKDRISKEAPLYWIDNDVQEVTDEIAGKEHSILMYSSLYQNNSPLHSITNSLLHNTHSNGYEPLPYTGKPYKIKGNEEKVITPYHPDSIPIKYFEKIEDLCKKNNILLVVSLSPVLVKYMTESFNSFITNYCKEKNIYIINYRHDPRIVNDLHYFKDGTHLNELGAEKFTKLLVSDIKKIEKNK